MLHEKDFEDIISKYPELIEEGLSLKGRQLTLFGRRMDLLFEDRFKRSLIVELKIGPIKDEHIGQVLSYEGMLLSADDPTIRVMLIGNRVPPNIQKSLDHHGIAWREISFFKLKEFLSEREDEAFLGLFNLEEPGIKNNASAGYKFTKPKFATTEELINALKSSEIYKCFKNILEQKNQNEDRARAIIAENLGSLNYKHVKDVISLVDEAYLYGKMGKKAKGPWFGRLLQSNTRNLLNADLVKLNNWFNVVSNNYLPEERRIDLLLNEPYNISGLNVGFITLMLYILDKNKFSVWFQALHEGLRLAHAEMEIFTGKSTQYILFNETAKNFALKYNFESAELDWIFSTGLPGMFEVSEKFEFKADTSLKISGTGELQLEYWTAFKSYMEVNKSLVKIGKPAPKCWSDISLGRSDTYLAVAVNSVTNLLNIWLVIIGTEAKTKYDKLYKIAYEDSLIELHRNIIWDRMEGRQRCAVKLQTPVDYTNKNDWGNQFQWFKENLEKYVRFFKPRILNI